MGEAVSLPVWTVITTSLGIASCILIVLVLTCTFRRFKRKPDSNTVRETHVRNHTYDDTLEINLNLTNEDIRRHELRYDVYATTINKRIHKRIPARALPCKDPLSTDELLPSDETADPKHPHDWPAPPPPPQDDI